MVKVTIRVSAQHEGGVVIKEDIALDSGVGGADSGKPAEAQAQAQT